MYVASDGNHREDLYFQGRFASLPRSRSSRKPIFERPGTSRWNMKCILELLSLYWKSQRTHSEVFRNGWKLQRRRGRKPVGYTSNSPFKRLNRCTYGDYIVNARTVAERYIWKKILEISCRALWICLRRFLYNEMKEVVLNSTSQGPQFVKNDQDRIWENFSKNMIINPTILVLLHQTVVTLLLPVQFTITEAHH